MKAKFIKITVAFLLFAVNTGIAEGATINLSKIEGLKNNIYMYRDTVKNIDGRFSFNSPMFMIYPDNPLSNEQANQLVDELGLGELASTYSGSVGVINPVGSTYNDAEDLEAYKEFINKIRVITNLKIIGIGKGATFVNNVISRNAYEVAGIFTYGGKMTAKAAGNIPVPAYIGLGDKSLAAYYAKINDAVETSKNEKHIHYANKAEPLQQVVLSLDKKVTLKEALDDAWKMLFSKNLRLSNYKHTGYMGGKFGEYGNYELEPYLMIEDLGVTRKTVKKALSGRDQPGGGTYFWYEFIPETVVNAPERSVPLVVLLHGNHNDNRTQSECSGFVQIAARENLIIAEIEWQGSGEFPSDVYLGLDGIELVVEDLFKTYPQIDPTRVYAQGLSAGAMASAAIGIKKSHLFAAVAGHSGGIFEFPAFGSSYQTLTNEAKQKAGHVETAYFLISGTGDMIITPPKSNNYQNNSLFNALRLYQLMNGIPEAEVDFNAEPVLGMKMKDRETIVTNKHLTIETGKLYKGDKPLIQFSLIIDYGHWNFYPSSQLMWDFFKQYSRHPETKKLIYHK